MENLINKINENISSLEYLNKIHGLCELVKRKDSDDKFKTFPAEYCKNAELKHLKLDEVATEVYHRHDGDVSRETGNKITGCDPEMIQTYPMLLIGFIKRKATEDNQYTPDRICLEIMNTIEFENDKILSNLIKANRVRVNAKSYSVDTNSIFNREYNGNSREQLSSEFFMFEVKYEIIVQGTKSCFQYC